MVPCRLVLASVYDLAMLPALSQPLDGTVLSTAVTAQGMHLHAGFVTLKHPVAVQSLNAVVTSTITENGWLM